MVAVLEKQRVRVIREWFEDVDSEDGWSCWPWEYMDTGYIVCSAAIERSLEITEIDKYGHPTEGFVLDPVPDE
jgi:hypothetical protein